MLQPMHVSAKAAGWTQQLLGVAAAAGGVHAMEGFGTGRRTGDGGQEVPVWKPGPDLGYTHSKIREQYIHLHGMAVMSFSVSDNARTNSGVNREICNYNCSLGHYIL